ncbi:EAL domain-containing protein [Pseudoxanthomonas sp. z9]|uniref:EAL domain-containing protein n=1 Tax=Pseudoxanthomonas sp. z9 TaxID=2584942 RepID=UPI0015E8E49E|nr:EAL domain-containing protein [Pseudoxanthomonas sp. z9]
MDAGLVSLACILLQNIDVGYDARFFDQPWLGGRGSLAHVQTGLLFAVALMGGDRRVLATAFVASFLGWWWRARLQSPEIPYIVGVAATLALQWRWTELCARWAGGPFGGRRWLHATGMGKYALVGLLVFPAGWAALTAALYAAAGESPASIANVAFQLLIAKHVGVGMLTLPLLLFWSDERLSRESGQRWVAAVIWLCLGLLAGLLLEDVPFEKDAGGAGSPAWMFWLYDYRALVAALLSIAMLRWRVEYSMPALTLAHLVMLHALTGQAQYAADTVQMARLALHLVEINFIALMLAMLFLVNRERLGRYRHVRAMGRHDASSGLANAHALRERWRRLSRPPPVVGFLLLDQIERVLGSYGWRAQTLLLREAGRIMRPLAEAHHLGGGEFVLLPRESSGPEEDAARMEEILRRLQGYVFQWQGARLHVNPYLGLAVPAQLGSQALDDCLADACDAALSARRSGEKSPLRATAASHAENNPQSRRDRLAVAAEALAAIHAGRIALYAQPIVRIDGGPSSPGFQGEVLCRLRTLDGRLLLPGDFMSELEDGGHAAELDIAVVERLFGWLRARPDRVSGITRIGVNLSGKSLASASFRARLSTLLEDAPLPLHALCFELTETAAITNQASALTLFRDLRARGCRLALDDFGSGVQNFERLKQMPVDSLKIDGQFVRNLQSQRSDLEIVRAAVAVANAHGLTTVAEYVENASLAEQLGAMGVQWGQGYHFGRPQPMEEWLPS